MIVAMFRTYLKPQANLNELGVLHEKMHAIVTNMPGFISVKMFTAEDLVTRPRWRGVARTVSSAFTVPPAAPVPPRSGAARRSSP